MVEYLDFVKGAQECILDAPGLLANRQRVPGSQVGVAGLGAIQGAIEVDSSVGTIVYEGQMRPLVGR